LLIGSNVQFKETTILIQNEQTDAAIFDKMYFVTPSGDWYGWNTICSETELDTSRKLCNADCEHCSLSTMIESDDICVDNQSTECGPSKQLLILDDRRPNEYIAAIWSDGSHIVPNIDPLGLTCKPTSSPTLVPTANPTFNPSVNPTTNPSQYPTYFPSNSPSMSPTTVPTNAPSKNPSSNPTVEPTFEPTDTPTTNPSKSPTYNPSVNPSYSPSNTPSSSPTSYPSVSPSSLPINSPTSAPTTAPSISPTMNPTTHCPMVLVSVYRGPTGMSGFSWRFDGLYTYNGQMNGKPHWEDLQYENDKNITYLGDDHWIIHAEGDSDYMERFDNNLLHHFNTSHKWIYSRNLMEYEVTIKCILSLSPTSSPTTTPTSIPTSNNPTIFPTAEPIFNPTNEPTVFPSFEPTSNPTAVPSISSSHIPSNIYIRSSILNDTNALQGLNTDGMDIWHGHFILIFIIFVILGIVFCASILYRRYTRKKLAFQITVENISNEIAIDNSPE